MSAPASRAGVRERRPPNMFEQLGLVLRAGLFWGIGLALFVLGGWVLSVLVEWAGMTFEWWRQPGAGHAEHMFRTELGYIDQHAVRGLFSNSPSALAREAAAWTGEAVTVGPAVQGWLDLYLAPIFHDDPDLVRWMKRLRVHGTEYAQAARYIAQVYAVRALILLFSIPLFVLVTACALQDGLIERERRKAGLGIERAGWYHRMKKIRSLALLLPLAFYLSSPWPTRPGLVLVPVALAFGVVFYQFVKSFKGRL